MMLCQYHFKNEIILKRYLLVLNYEKVNTLVSSQKEFLSLLKI